MKDRKQLEDIDVDMKYSVMKPLTARWIISAYDYLRHEGEIVRGGFVEGGICEAVDKPESDSESEEDPFDVISMNSRDNVKRIDLDCACVLLHYLNRHLFFND